MRKYWKRYAAVCLAGGLVLTQLAGCKNSGGMEAGAEASAWESREENEKDAAGYTAEAAEDGSITVTAQLGENRTKTVRYLPEDLEAEWDADTATGIVLEDSGVIVEGNGARKDGSNVVIEEGGTYVVSGEAKDRQILIHADDDAVVRLVLNGVRLASTTTAPIFSQEKNKVILTLAPGTVNVISDSDACQYDEAGGDEPNAPVFVKGDLTINGTGELQVQGNYQDGIRSKGDLLVMSGSISVDAQGHGLKGKDSVAVRGGTLDIRSGKDGIKSNNDSDEEKGFVWIDGGSIVITAQDDGIQAETALIVSGGEITVTESQEGLAGRTVDILGGLIRANTSDDGINSAASVDTEREKMQDQEGVYTRIAGGEIWLNAQADGIDSNGDLLIEGGALYLSGPTGNGDGILDYNGTGTITGGTVFAAGSAGMMQTFGDTSTQNYLVVYYTETQKAGTTLRLLDDSGSELGSYAPEKEYQAVIISSPDIRTGNTYRVASDEVEAELMVSGIVTIYGTAPNTRPGGGFGGGCGDGGERMRPEGAGAPEDGQDGGGKRMRPDGAEMRKSGQGRGSSISDGPQQAEGGEAETAAAD